MSVSRTHRLAGVGVTLTIAIVAQLMLRASLGKKEARRAEIAAKADEARRTAQALEVAHRVPDTASITSNEWTGHDARAPLMALARCVELFSGTNGGPFPLSLRELQRWSRNDERSGGCASTLAVSREDSSAMSLSASDGHLMRYGHPSAPTPMDRPGPFALESEAIWDAVRFPFDARRVGVRNYLLDTSGTLHVTDQQRRATERDSVVRPCVPGESATITSCVVKYAPRERWGAFGFPMPRIMMRRDVRVGDELGPTFSFTPVNALDSIANATVQWGHALPDTPQEVQFRAPISDDRNAMTATLTHVYPTPGARQLTFVVTTRSGVQFETRDSILMQPPTHGPLHD